MTPKTLAELMKLSPSEREELVTSEWENYVDDRLETEKLEHETAEFFAELDRRSAEAKANPGSGIPWEEVKRKLLALDEE
jgi:putative addiction module component (TIGR02574 family)